MFWMFFFLLYFRNPLSLVKVSFFLFLFGGGRTSNSYLVGRFLKIAFFPSESQCEYSSLLFPSL